MGDVELDARVGLMREYGTFPQAFSATFQEGLSHFGDERGFIAYTKVWSTALALADPVAPRSDWGDLITDFLAVFPDAGFWQTSRPMAELLAARGFFVNEMGPDTRIDLAGYLFSGRKKQNLRNAINLAAKRGYSARECQLSSIDIAQVTALSEAWRRTRTIDSREVAFLNRPMVVADEPDVRKFFLFDPNEKIVALGCFDPIYESGAVVGYVAQQNRYGASAALFADYAIKCRAIETFRAEGKRWLYLGLSPFAYIEDKDFLPHKNWLVRRGFRWAYTSTLFNRFFYPLQGHEAHKRHFRGVPQQTYYCFNRLPSLPRLLRVLRACKIV
jgi:phosphatidylglycerol lysyltransferase